MAPEGVKSSNGEVAGISNGDVDALETREWLDSLEGVLQSEGSDRARYLLSQLKQKAERSGVEIPFTANTPYINTIPRLETAPLSRPSRNRTTHQEHRPLERHDHGRPGQ